MPHDGISNPILNSPFAEPNRFHAFDEDGITNTIEHGRRPSSYFVPIAQPRKRTKPAKGSKQLKFTDDEEKNESRQNDDINAIRQRVKLWRASSYPGITAATRTLLNYWKRDDRERKLFFCQIEALETLIYLAEADDPDRGAILAKHKAALAAAAMKLPRYACKMATGSGKTAVMAMIVAWHTLNHVANPTDDRFTDAFLAVAPGITIRDRLRVLLPSDPENYYQKLDLVPPEHLSDLGTAQVVITNFHTFKLRETVEAPKFTKQLAGAKPGAFTEKPPQMARRVCRAFGSKKGIVVLNDEAHHCYRSKKEAEARKLKGDEKKDADQRDEEARLWLTGLEAVHKQFKVRAVYDLSATPFYLDGSGYTAGTLFGWCVSDFSLIDAIECGIVKIPRVPVLDDTLGGDLPTFRELWLRVRDDLPKKGRAADGASGPPQSPKQLEAALHAFYRHYRQKYAEWEKDTDAVADGRTPPVFIVVCNNTAVSKMLFDFIAGYETELRHPDDTPVYADGALPLFSNVDHGRLVTRANTILVDSAQLESDEGMSADFKKLAGPQIDEFKADYRSRFPDRNPDDISDQTLMREVLNTVGKAGKLGENVRCVVSVSMLTEGWDCNTVTHVLGVRAFGTQLLCEQVVGRGLRRASYTLNDEGHFDPEYADVYGVPFQFIPYAGEGGEQEQKEPKPKPGRVRALPERARLEITFPRVTAYRYELPPERVTANFSEQSRLVLSTADVPTKVINEPIVGEAAVMTLDDLRQRREQEVVFAIAREVLTKYYPADPGSVAADGSKVWLFPQLVDIARRWVRECVVLKDSVFPQLLLLAQLARSAAEKIHRAIAAAADGTPRVRAVVQHYDPQGSSAIVSFDSRRSRLVTDRNKCHVNFVVYDSDWERHVAQTLEWHEKVVAYVKNDHLGFKIPYTHEGKARHYFPDYIVRIDDGKKDLLNLVLEVSGQAYDDKQAKTDTARTLWVPAVNAEGRFGRWAFLELTDPLSAQKELNDFLSVLPVG